MIWYNVAVVIDFLVDVFTVRWKTADKDLEILLLRQQLCVLERRLGQQARPGRWEKCFLAVLLVQFKQVTGYSRAQLGTLLPSQKSYGIIRHGAFWVVVLPGQTIYGPITLGVRWLTQAVQEVFTYYGISDLPL